MKVYQAINAVQAELSAEGLAKNHTASGFGAGYQFRGIDDLYLALSPKLARHGLVIIPRCMERHESQRQSGPKTLYFVVVRMEFDFVCAEDGSKHTACTYGEAMDSGDKATNKAMSIAYKYACFQTFAIPTEGDNDPDATVHEPAPARQQQKPSNSQSANKQQQQANQPRGNPKVNPSQQQTLVHPDKVIADIGNQTDLAGLGKIEQYVDSSAYPPDVFESLKQHIYNKSCDLKSATQVRS